MDYKKLGIDLLVVVVGVIVALKVKEQMDRAMVSPPSAKK